MFGFIADKITLYFCKLALLFPELKSLLKHLRMVKPGIELPFKWNVEVNTKYEQFVK